MLTEEPVSRLRECSKAQGAQPGCCTPECSFFDIQTPTDWTCQDAAMRALLAARDEQAAEIARLRAVADAARALLADPEWCSCMTINPNSRHAHDRPNIDYPATCEICGALDCTGRVLNDALFALAALDAEATDE